MVLSNGNTTAARREITWKGTEDDDTFVSSSSNTPDEDNSIRSSAHQRAPRKTPSLSSNPPRRTSSTSKVERSKKQASVSQPRRSKSGSSSQHSRGSYDSRASSSADTLSSSINDSKYINHLSIASSSSTASFNNKQKPSRSGRRPGSSQRSFDSLSSKLSGVGSNGNGSLRNHNLSSHGSVTSYATPVSAIIPDLFSKQQSRSSNDDDYYDDDDGDDTLIETPMTHKTAFEFDAPRGDSLRQQYSHRPSSPSNMSTISEPSITDPHLSEEQYAWAGIDALLETKNLDDSFAFSTTDILPSSIVRAMRKTDDASVMDDDISEYTEMPYSMMMNKKNVSLKKSGRFGNGMPSLIEASDQDEDSDGRIGAKGSGGGNGTLFDVFHWSEKDNVDETRQRKTKLNQTRRAPVQTRFKSDVSVSDTCSLPSLATCREDEFSVRSEQSSWHSMASKGSVVTEDVFAMRYDREMRAKQTAATAAETEAAAVPIPMNIDTSNAPQTSSIQPGASVGGKLVLDKSVDEYINKLQKQLPSNANRKNKKKFSVGFLADIDENASFAVDTSAFDELPSLIPAGMTSENGKSSATSRGKEEKKDRTQTVSSKFMKSIKGMRGGSKTGKPQNRGVVQGDEEKYFPDTFKSDESRSNANRCLLNDGSGDD